MDIQTWDRGGTPDAWDQTKDEKFAVRMCKWKILLISCMLEGIEKRWN